MNWHQTIRIFHLYSQMRIIVLVLPLSPAPSSESISPNRFVVTITSNVTWLGHRKTLPFAYNIFIIQFQTREFFSNIIKIVLENAIGLFEYICFVNSCNFTSVSFYRIFKCKSAYISQMLCWL